MSQKEQQQLEVAALRKVIQDAGGIKFKVVDNEAQTIIPENLFDKILDETDPTMEQLVRLQRKSTNFGVAVLEEAGEQLPEVFKANPGLANVAFQVPTVGRDYFEYGINRESKGRNPKTQEEVISYGSSAVKFVTHSADNVGAMAAVRDKIKADCKAAYGG